MTEYAYTTRWNPRTGRPAAGHEWLSEAQARERFENGQELSVVRVELRRESDGAVRGNWVIGFGGVGARVQWLSQKHTIIRINDYFKINGRLFRNISVDYEYADGERRYGLSESLVIRKMLIETDGTGSVLIDDKEHSRRKKIPITDYPTAGLWMDYPVFGDWEQLGDMGFGDE